MCEATLAGCSVETSENGTNCTLILAKRATSERMTPDMRAPETSKATR